LVFHNRALRTIILWAALAGATSAAAAAHAEARVPLPPAQPNLTRAILRDKDLGPTVPQMSGGANLIRADDRTIRAPRTADRAC
jgi:hypothetical protein